MKKFGMLACSLLIACQANAGFVLSNGQSVEALELKESVIDFYDRGGDVIYSSNTGYEQKNSVVAFLTSYMDELSLVVLIDGTSVQNDNTSGNASVSLNSDSLSNDFLLIDDPNDVVTKTATGYDLSFKWNKAYNDGFIYDMTDVENLSLLFTSKQLDDFLFLSFEDGGVIEYDTGNDYAIDYVEPVSLSPAKMSEVSEPANVGLLAMGLIGLAAAGRKRKKISKSKNVAK